MEAITEALNGDVKPQKLSDLPAYNDSLSPDTLATFAEELKSALANAGVRPFKITDSMAKRTITGEATPNDIAQNETFFAEINKGLLV